MSLVREGYIELFKTEEKPLDIMKGWMAFDADKIIKNAEDFQLLKT